MAEVGITEIQAILDSVLTSIGWQHEPDEDGLIGGAQEYSLPPLGALRLRTHHVYIWPNGTASLNWWKVGGEVDNAVSSTEIQSKILRALEPLHFEQIPDGKCGGVAKLKLPLGELKKLRRSNIVVKSDGEISFIYGNE